MFQALLYQVLYNQPKITRDVLRHCRETAVKNKPTTNPTTSQIPLDHRRLDCKSLLLDALRISCERFERVTIFVDGLDEFWDNQPEYNQPWDNGRSELRSEIEFFLGDLKKSDKFVKLRLCLSSRNLGAFRWFWFPMPVASRSEHETEGAELLVVEVHLENHIAIRTYIDERLRLYSEDTDELVTAKHKLEEMSCGNFLWAQSMADRLIESLRQNHAGRLSMQTQPLPLDLKTEYSFILQSAEDPLKTWRFFHWMFLAPDLGLNGWRYIIPFLRDKPPWSLEKARGFKASMPLRTAWAFKCQDWAMDLDATPVQDRWVTELQRMICRLSLGLAEVAPLPKTSIDRPIGDYHSAAGEAGSWITADGNRWIVRPVHHFVQRFLQDEGGFHILNPRVKDQRGGGLLMAMKTCLDFINAQEFRTLDVFELPTISPHSQASGDSLLSDGDASARTSISSGSVSSARSFGLNRRNNPVRRKSPGGSLPHSSGSTASTPWDHSETIKKDFRVAVLAHLKQAAERHPTASLDKLRRVRHWIQSLREDLDDPNPATDSDLELSSMGSETDTWSSELLAYVMTAFPRFAKAAEKAGVDPMSVITRLHEGRLWGRLRCLCESTGESASGGTSLMEWAESQGLQKWVTSLAYDKPDPFMHSERLANEVTAQQVLELPRFGPPRTRVDINLTYCLDGGSRSITQLESMGTPTSFPLSTFNGIGDRDDDLEIQNQLRRQLWSVETKTCEPGGKHCPFIPQRSLREILSEGVLSTLLRMHTSLDPDRAVEIRASYVQVLAILLLIGEVSHMEQLFERGLNDAYLPIKVVSQDQTSWKTVIASQVPGKETFVTNSLEFGQWLEFEKLQWEVLSPFLARPAGLLHHYQLVSEKQPLPIIERKTQDSFGDNLGYELEEIIRFHNKSFEFEEDIVRDNVTI